MNNRKTIRILNVETIELIEKIKTENKIKNENLIINEALRFGLPLYIEHLNTTGGITPTENPKYTHILQELKKLNSRLDLLELIRENQIIQLAVQEIDEAIVSSTYSRLKYFISTQPYAVELSEAEDLKMDFRLPIQYQKKKEEYIQQVLATEKDGDEKND